ncbi:glycosyltransferase family 2 protein [Candidatus Gottesmanbacteria bacterium]|nr:glycosyltransferase family 2 protein [Candidatus Gottesmanbacteria bacterium]
MLKKPVELSIIIISYNTKDILKDCLVSLFAAKTTKDSWEIIVVDNASSDGSPEMITNEFPDVMLLPQKKNAGFSVGNNLGMRKSKGEYILLLNSDTQVPSGSIQETLQYLKHHADIGVVTCKLIRSDGSMDPACHRGFPTPWAALTYFAGLEKLFPKSKLFGQYHQGYKDLSQPHGIDSPSGAFYMVRREVVDKVGFLDEQFFMYGEDLDWSYRIKAAGWKIMFYPAVNVIHKKWQSGKAHPEETQRRLTQKYFFDAMKLFYKKHYAHRYGWLVTGCVLLGIKLRSLL